MKEKEAAKRVANPTLEAIVDLSQQIEKQVQAVDAARAELKKLVAKRSELEKALKIAAIDPSLAKAIAGQGIKSGEKVGP